MQKKYLQRLEQVVRVLEELPREKKFNLRTWMTCSTTACACGWAGMDPWFRQRGFKTENGESAGGFTVFFKNNTDFTAVRAFFGLKNCDVYFLFAKPKYPRDGSKRAVIRRLKAFIAENRA